MIRMRTYCSLALLCVACWIVASSQGCSAGTETSEISGPATTTGPGPSNGGSAGAPGTGGDGGEPILTTTGGGGIGGDGTGGIPVDPCNSECGPTELCDGVGVAIDDNCDGQVDEGCNCTAGQISPCFKGDPAFLNDDGCFPGTMTCTELGSWGECTGGVHATEDCFLVGQGCQAISTPPFVTADLTLGVGNFANDAVSDSYSVACPPGIGQCPMVQNMNQFTPLQSGEYTVTYMKTTAMGMDQCEFPLFVGAPGLRVELAWEWDYPNLGGNDTVDLDLHVHKPQDSSPWGGTSGGPNDCAYNNCTASAFQFAGGVDWFNGVMPPDPVDWYLDPILEKNTCYFGPKGNGMQWQMIGMGCHNPRLDIDNVFCDPAISDPGNFNFCNPENINIDFMPLNQWTRIAVHYFSSHGQPYDVHPVVKVFCNGQLTGDFGPQGFYTPNQPVTFTPADSSTRYWLVADVLFREDECASDCVVAPIYQDAATLTPLLTTTDLVTQSVGPPYPPPPQ